MVQDNTKTVIEALLFSSEKPLTLEQIKNVLDHLETSEIRKFLEELKSEYETDGRGMRITEIAGGFQMITPSNLAPFLRKFYKDRRPDKLSRSALETLAIVAYKQPVTRLEIESIRNVSNIDTVIYSLLGKNLIRIAGRKDAPGRPHVFGTTKQFLEYFGLKSLEELPKIDNFLAMAKNKEKENESRPLSEAGLELNKEPDESCGVINEEQGSLRKEERDEVKEPTSTN